MNNYSFNTFILFMYSLINMLDDTEIINVYSKKHKNLVLTYSNKKNSNSRRIDFLSNCLVAFENEDIIVISRNNKNIFEYSIISDKLKRV